MKTDRKKYRWKERKFRDRQFKQQRGGVLKHDPLMGSTQAKGIVVEKVGLRPSDQTLESGKLLRLV